MVLMDWFGGNEDGSFSLLDVRGLPVGIFGTSA